MREPDESSLYVRALKFCVVIWAIVSSTISLLLLVSSVVLAYQATHDMSGHVVIDKAYEAVICLLMVIAVRK